jgi:hypothetical protein
MQSIFSALSNVFSSNTAAPAAPAMRGLSASEVSAVAGAPELGHDVVTVTATVVALPPVVIKL